MVAVEFPSIALVDDGGVQHVRCTPLERELFECLAGDPYRVFSRELRERVWGYATYRETNAVDVTVCSLRRKLADAGVAGVVVNCHGRGWSLRRRPS